MNVRLVLAALYPPHLLVTKCVTMLRRERISVSYQKSKLTHGNIHPIIYLLNGGRLGLQKPIAFHCTRVNTPDKDDQRKLVRIIWYLEATKFLPIICLSTSLE